MSQRNISFNISKTPILKQLTIPFVIWQTSKFKTCTVQITQNTLLGKGQLYIYYDMSLYAWVFSL